MIALILAATLIDPRMALVGTWTGESLCTPVRAACHDEHAVYHIVLSKDPSEVKMTMNKLVDGKEVVMGTLDYQVDADATHLSCEFTYGDVHGLWSFTRSGDEMRGTLTVPPHEAVIRNIRLAKVHH
jgi:hypothetical protein